MPKVTADPQSTLLYKFLFYGECVIIPLWSVLCLWVTVKLYFRKEIQEPVETLSKASEKILGDDLDFKVECSSDNELGKLCRSFEEMRKNLYDSNYRLWKSLEERKRLNSAFSHDLRTPITVLKGYTELMNQFDGQISHEKQAEMMNDTDDMLGGGSSYGAERIVSEFSRVPLTYEDALEEYNSFLKDDRVTYAHARLYCDYMGIELSFMPVFAAAALAAADRRRKAEEVIYSSGISSVKLVFTRYAALVAVMFIPVLITMAVAFVQVLILYRGYELNIPSMFILPAVWLIPEIMTATAVGMLLTELFSAGAAIAVQIVWGFTCLMTGDSKLYGDIGKFDLICRHNNWGEREIFMMQSGNFIFNRIFYTVISAAAVLLAAYVYTLKREGVFNGIRITGQGGIFRRKA